MTAAQLQQELTRLGYNVGKIDGVVGDKTKAAVLKAFTDGPDTPLTLADVQKAAARLRVSVAHIWAVYDVEAAGNPFMDGRPTILFEPHIFSRLTNHRYDASHPRLSSRKWNRALYPKTQAARWQQLLDALALDADAALGAASYGGFQVLGSHWRALGYKSSFDFVHQQSLSVGEQLETFVEYVEVNGLADELRASNWAGFARGYNGPGYAQNQYDKRLAKRFALRS